MRRAGRSGVHSVPNAGQSLGLLQSLQDLAGDAQPAILSTLYRADAETALGVELRVFLAQAVAAPRDLADARATSGRTTSKTSCDQLLRRDVAFPRHRAGVLVLDLGAPVLELRGRTSGSPAGCRPARSR